MTLTIVGLFNDPIIREFMENYCSAICKRKTPCYNLAKLLLLVTKLLSLAMESLLFTTMLLLFMAKLLLLVTKLLLLAMESLLFATMLLLFMAIELLLLAIRDIIVNKVAIVDNRVSVVGNRVILLAIELVLLAIELLLLAIELYSWR